MPKILFLCTGNSCRSQMAEGWFRHFHGEKWQVFSAGIETHGLNPNAVKVMAEKGIDISKQSSQHVEAFQSINFDLVVTVCDHAQENCPILLEEYPTLHISFPDPPRLAKEREKQGATPEEQLQVYREVRDQIAKFCQNFSHS